MLLALVLVVTAAWFLAPYAMSGYGGISAKINNVEHNYPKTDAVSIVIQPTIATVTPTTLGPIGASGLRLELGQPQYTGDDLWYENTFEQTTDEGLLIREWNVRIAYFDLSWTITTDGGGILAINDVSFWIELKENEFDVFTAADEVEAYILEVVTTTQTEVNDAVNVKVSPTAEGFNFDLVSLRSEQIPDWMSDAGYQGVLSEFKEVKFMCSVESMQPTQIVHLRFENGATWRTQVRVLVFGFWELFSPYDDWKFKFVGWLDFLDDLFQGLEIIIGLAVGILLSVILLKFIPDKRLAIALLLVLWVVVFIGFGFMELFA